MNLETAVTDDLTLWAAVQGISACLFLMIVGVFACVVLP